MRTALRVLVVDDEQPALDELAWLLGRDERVGEVLTCTSGPEALRVLGEQRVDALLLDVQMPGLSGLELAGVLARFREPPPVVFVTAHTEHAVAAFELDAVDYLLKPVREVRLREALRRVVEARPAVAGDRDGDPGGDPTGVHPAPAAPRDDTIAVELGGVTRFVTRSEVRFVEAQGDYARLHTVTGSHLVRMPLTALEERWADAGFLRPHRSLLVALDHVSEVRTEGGRLAVVVGDRELPVSRRHAPALREALRRTRRTTPAPRAAPTEEQP